MATTPDRQKRIMEHLARSSGNFINPNPSSLNSEQRKQQIMEHIRLTKG